MCGRFTLHHSTAEIAQRFAVQQVMFDFPPRYNIAPSQPVAVITQNGVRALESHKWGLVPFWAKDPNIGNRLINARAETLAEKPAFKNALTRRRCLIPADGFYEWKKAGKVSTPLRVRMGGDALFALAGLWEEWNAPDGSPLRTCTIITTTPNELMASIHNRMPAILQAEDEATWLDPGLKDVPTILSLLHPYPDGALEAHVVSRRVNAPAFDDESCIAAIEGDEE
ncbi:MAG TPA: SOS response-associated peptidase [Abditibacteriaceae bacterium]|nr:SOS response-associated peptidase [Abditibacteriaceae bacterium]